MKHTIFTTDYDADEQYKEYINNCEINEITPSDNQSQDFYNFISDYTSNWYDDEKGNLSEDVGAPIIAIVDLGRWDGRKSAYKILSSNLSDIVYSFGADDINLYADSKNKNVYCTGYHHDGTNYITFRKFKTDNPDKIEELTDLIYSGQADKKTINKYTKSIYSDVAKVYGW